MKPNWSMILKVCAAVLVAILRLSTNQEDEEQP